MRDKIFEAKCSELGRLPSSRACKQHVPDAFTLMQDQESRMESMIDMGAVFKRMSVNDMQILAAILLNEKKTRRAGFHFMQKVYIRYAGSAGRNYLSNFVLGYVMDANKEIVRVVSETARTAVSMPNDKDSQSLYTVAQFAEIRKEIYDNRKFRDPEVVSNLSKVSSNSIANLDQVDEVGGLDTPIAARRKIKKAKQKDDLVTFVAKLGRGVIKTRKAESNSDEELTISW